MLVSFCLYLTRVLKHRKNPDMSVPNNNYCQHFDCSAFLLKRGNKYERWCILNIRNIILIIVKKVGMCGLFVNIFFRKRRTLFPKLTEMRTNDKQTQRQKFIQNKIKRPLFR